MAKLSLTCVWFYLLLARTAHSIISPTDRIYSGDQSSNTITVIQPSKNKVLGTIALGSERLSDNLFPQYNRVVNSHGLGFSRDGKYIVSLSITTNTVTVIRTVDNVIVSQTYVDRSPHEATFAPDNRTVWVGTRGVDSITLVDGLSGGIVEKIPSYGGPSKVVFSPDGRIAYVNHIRSASVSVIDVDTHKYIANITGIANIFSSDFNISPDGKSLWVAHKPAGTVSIINTANNTVIGVLSTGVETNHPSFAFIKNELYGFVTVAAENSTKVYKQPDANKLPVYVTSILSSGVEPHGLWPSPDFANMYILNEHSDTLDVVSLSNFSVTATLPIGQEGQALVYVPNAVPSGDGTKNLGAQGLHGKAAVNRQLNIKAKTYHKENPTALVTIRPQAGLDMFQVIGANLALNVTYVASAACSVCNGNTIPLVEFKATTTQPNGCGNAPQVLAFFKWDGVYDLETLTISEK